MKPTTILEMKAALRSGDVTSVQLVEAAFQRIEAVDGTVGAFLALNREGALAQACLADQRGYAEDAPLLNGIPIAVKDNIVTKDLLTTAASRILEDFIPTYNATVVEKLEAAGAVIIGKVNLDEFAMGASGERSAFKISRNPWDTTRVPGGSSSGSAASVAAREVPASLGSDTGGSIRQPAAFTGLVGMKPTYGAVSRYGLIAFASSLDQIGPLTQTVADNALVLEAIAGHDPKDATSIPNIDTHYSAKMGQSLKGLKIGFPIEYRSDVVQKEIREQMEAAAEFFRSCGATVEDVSLPYSKYGINVYYIMASSEASSNLQRFDGIRYGYRSQSATTLEEVYVQSRSEGFGEEVQRRIMLGTFSLSSGYYDAYFKKAAQVRTLISQDFERVFAEYDVIMGPVTTSTAFEIGGRVNDPLEMYLADLLTVPANLAGIPGISVPAGFDMKGLPIGLQLMGAPLSEATLYQVAAAYEAAHDYVNQVPNI